MQESWERLFQHMSPPVPFAKRILESTGVQKRHIMWDPDMLPQVCAMLTGDRMAAHAEAVMDVASRSIKQTIGGLDTSRIGSFVMACSTGYVNPGPDLLIAKELGLRSDLRRTFIGHMGCYAALNVIKVAMDSVAARPDELVICNCTELSSAHVRNSPMPGEDPMESLITQALFGDASVSMLMGSAPEGTGIQFLRTHTEQLYDQHTMMSLNVGNQSFWMTLATGVPAVLQENIDGFLVKLLQPLGLSAADVTHWGIHPGGPKILRVLGKQLALRPSQLRASWDVLANAGNCASATVLLVLENILRVDKPRRGDYGVLLTFGPGLTIEGAVVRF
ncbi:MAG TPA: 3-oxoacyl-[acyl-carrier-protein] synthase III C-terminal domain-containing protein [Mycobacterium sp.]|jgi:predicted naringenin-chalcone synthase|nr:3-oxoacyl-[acyl-carrier-protein] synthase III C-terminal domain-containing protein [Mycobacterium sp.]